MRVTNQIIVESALHAIQESLERQEVLHSQARTDQLFQVASKDPGAGRAAVNLRSTIQTVQSSIEESRMTRTWIESTEFALKQLIELGTQAVNKVLDGFSDFQTQNQEAIATELDGILQQAIELGNTWPLGNTPFLGFTTRTRPFTLESGLPDTVTYNGDAGQIQRLEGSDQPSGANLDGEALLNPFLSSLINLRDALFANDPAAISSAIPDLRSALDSLSLARTDFRARQQQVKAMLNQGEEVQRMLQGFLTQKEDANIVEVISSLKQQENVYQATLAVTSRTLATIKLFDLLR